MHHFAYRDGVLHAEDVNLAALAEEIGTPFYCYSTATLERHYRVMDEAFAGTDHTICYAMKANSNQAVIKTMAGLGAGVDVVSEGELRRALAAGVPARKIVFSGVGKTAAEMRLALSEGIHQFNVESAAELRLLSEMARMQGRTAPVALRVNPDVAAGGHPNISTGKSGDKFGVPWNEAEALYAEAASLPGIRCVGVDVHIGSQIGDLAPMRAAFEKVVALALRLRGQGHDIRRIDVGGGLGIPYKDGDSPAPPSAYAAMIAEVTAGHGFEVILEPGRVIAGNAGVLLTTALYEKQAPDRTFLIVDAGMNDLIRPALYGAHHDILPVAEPAPGHPDKVYDVVGPICESTDKFAAGRTLPAVSPGDRLAFMSAGAYGAVLSSAYNARPLVPEILVDDDRFEIVRRRPSFEESIALEKVPDWLTTVA
jgi:diaminopimelate decarboxylase